MTHLFIIILMKTRPIDREKTEDNGYSLNSAKSMLWSVTLI